MINIAAIPTLVVIGFVVHFLDKYFPSLSKDHSDLVYGTAFLVIGGATEFCGLPGRVLFLPIWVLGIIVIGFGLGWMGILGVIVVLGICIYVFNQRLKKAEAAAWPKAQAALTRAEAALNASEMEFFKWLNEALFLSTNLEYTPEMCAHNLAVLEVLGQSRWRFHPRETAAADVLARLMAQPPGEKPKKLEWQIEQAIKNYINERAEGKIVGNSHLMAGANEIPPVRPPPIPEA